jgi:hypothetical protein
LAPTGHTTIDQTRVALSAHIGPDAEAFSHAGTEPFDENVIRFYKVQNGLDAGGMLQIYPDGSATATE